MENQQQESEVTQQKSEITVFKAVLTTIVIIIISGLIIGVLPKLGISPWVFMLLFFVFSAIEQFNISKIPNVLVGAFVGITLGFGLPLLNIVFLPLGPSSQLIALGCYLIIIITALTLMILGKFTVGINTTTWIFMLILAMIPGVAELDQLVPSYSAFAVIAVLLGTISYIMKKKAASKITN